MGFFNQILTLKYNLIHGTLSHWSKIPKTAISSVNSKNKFVLQQILLVQRTSVNVTSLVVLEL